MTYNATDSDPVDCHHQSPIVMALQPGQAWAEDRTVAEDAGDRAEGADAEDAKDPWRPMVLSLGNVLYLQLDFYYANDQKMAEEFEDTPASL